MLTPFKQPLEKKFVDMIENCGLEVEDVQHIIYEAQRDAIRHLANTVEGAYESGFIDKPEAEAKDIVNMIRQHGIDNYGE